jgi:peptidyl-tRNA hydrolase ICT1
LDFFSKANSGIEIRFHVDTANWIPEWIRQKLKEKYNSKITKDGYFIVTSEKTRKNLLNQADCLDRIRECIREASREPRGLDEHEKLKIEIK